MGIDEREPAAELQVLQGHIFDERRFSGAGLSDDVDVGKSVFGPNAEFMAAVFGVGAPEISQIHTSELKVWLTINRFDRAPDLLGWQLCTPTRYALPART